MASEVKAVARTQRDLERLRELDRECREASADADQQSAGMREVALFRAANAKAVMGGYAVSLAERLLVAEEALQRAEALAEEWRRFGRGGGGVEGAVYRDVAHRIDAALAAPAPAPQGEDQ